MKEMIREEIKNLIRKSVPGDTDVKIEKPEKKEFGDYSTNIALQLKRPPVEIANKLKSDLFEKVEVIPPGFINFFISKDYLQKQVREILKEKDKFGSLKIGKGKKINVEFVSANPTGPLHIGNGRGGYCGDVLASVLKKAGYEPYREYYVNDRGRQMEFLKNSLLGKEPSYNNEYIDDLKKKGEKDSKKAVKYIVDKIQKTVRRMGIKFDRWFYERELYDKETEKVIEFLKEKNLIYEKEGAVWFNSTKFGDDKDRVLVRAKEKTTYEEETYFLSDIAYLQNKFKRGFECLIIFLGAEHHGYTPRLKAAAEALGYDPENVRPIIMQLVRVLERGRQVRMSKRTGTYVTLDELMDEVDQDASRFFFLTRNYGSHLNFELDLARQKSEKNPVYYVQYAHARISSILKKIKNQDLNNEATVKNIKLLNHQNELNLIKQLVRLPEIIEDTVKDYQVQRLPQYAIDLATVFHQFYRDCRVISDNRELTQARLSLVLATKIVLKNTLELMGISVPEKM